MYEKQGGKFQNSVADLPPLLASRIFVLEDSLHQMKNTLKTETRF
jgi:hypothetical protein